MPLTLSELERELLTLIEEADPEGERREILRLQRKLTDLVERIRRALTEPPVERGRLPKLRTPAVAVVKTRDGKRIVRVEALRPRSAR